MSFLSNGVKGRVIEPAIIATSYDVNLIELSKASFLYIAFHPKMKAEVV